MRGDLCEKGPPHKLPLLDQTETPRTPRQNRDAHIQNRKSTFTDSQSVIRNLKSKMASGSGSAQRSPPQNGLETIAVLDPIYRGGQRLACHLVFVCEQVHLPLGIT